MSRLLLHPHMSGPAFQMEPDRITTTILPSCGQTIGEVILMRYVPGAPENFLGELDRNEPARDRFYALSQEEQQRIIHQAQSVRDIYEMRALVNSIRA